MPVPVAERHKLHKFSASVKPDLDRRESFIGWQSLKNKVLILLNSLYHIIVS